jgi:hypothetical protein
VVVRATLVVGVLGFCLWIRGGTAAGDPDGHGAAGGNGDSPQDGENISPASIVFSLPSLEARIGEVVSVPFTLESTAPLSMVALSVEFDPSALEFLGPPLLHPTLERIFEALPPDLIEFTWHFDNTAGWTQLLIVSDFLGRDGFAIPPGLTTALATLEFRIRPEARPGRYPLVFARRGAARFEGHFAAGGNPVYNAARPAGRPFTRDDLFDDGSEPDLQDGVIVGIIGDVGIFARGDANLDGFVDVSDPLRILGFLFLAGSPLECFDAADGNADGQLDISDPVQILNYLFVGASEASVPNGGAAGLGVDEVSCPR